MLYTYADWAHDKYDTAVAQRSAVSLQKVLLCVGTTLCNFLMTAFFR